MGEPVLGEIPVDQAGLQEIYRTAPVSDSLAAGQIFHDAQLTPKIMGLLGEPDNDVFVAPHIRGIPASEIDPGEYQRLQLTPEQAKDRFDIDVKEPVGVGHAANLAHQQADRRFRDEVLGRSDINPLQALGAGLAGGLLDPAGLPLIFAPEVLGVRTALEGALEARAAYRGSEAVVRAGRLANATRGALAGAGEGLISGAIYESANNPIRQYSGEDYDLGDSLANIVLGGVIGGAFGGAAGVLRRPGSRMPALVRGVDEDTRVGALALALDRAADDAPVDIAGALEAQEARARPSAERLRKLDEIGYGGELPQRPLEDAVAVTTRGAEIPVRYALVELDHLTTSHTNDLERNPAYPPELQPRDRARAGAQAHNYGLESELNPKLLMRDVSAASGAPIVAADGTVESGNGRTIALRRSAATGSPAYERYRAELAAQGFDTTGMEKPVLVRIRTQAMTGEDRAALARGMNADVTERLGAAEQAMADAEGLDDATMEALGEGAAAGRNFATKFIGRVAGDQINTLVDAGGNLSVAGHARVRAALVAKAFGDQKLVETLFEAGENAIKAIGNALSDAAPAWAKMRSLIERGEVPAAYDLTANLRSAVELVRWARESGRPVGEVIAERLDQLDAFSGQAISPESEAFLRLFFRTNEDGTTNWKLQRASGKIAEALNEYARQASDVTPGPNLFGETPDAGSARSILDKLNERFAAGDAAAPAGPDLFEPVQPRERPETGGGGQGSGEQAGGGGGQAGVKPARRVDTTRKGRWGDIPPDAVQVVWGADAQGVPEIEALIDEIAPKLPPGTRLLADEVGFGKLKPAIRVWRPGWPDGTDFAIRPGQNLDGLAKLIAELDARGAKSAEGRAAEQAAMDAQRVEETAPPAPGRAEAIIAGDEELAAIQADTEALIAAYGEDLPPAVGAADPEVLAEAIRAAAFCLREG